MIDKTTTTGFTSNQLQLEEKLLVLPELTIMDGLQIGEVAKLIGKQETYQSQLR